MSRAQDLVEGLKKVAAGREYVTKEQVWRYLSENGFGSSRQSLYNILEALQAFNLLRKDGYDTGIYYFVVQQVKVEDKQKGIGDFIDDTFTKK
jgi:Fe2+ or Zn2+ uptake regulation protein